MSLTNRFTSYHELISLELEELAAVLLMEVQGARNSEEWQDKQHGRRQSWPSGIALADILWDVQNHQDSPEWPRTMFPQVKMAVHEAWAWLISAVLIMPHPEGGPRVILTRRGAVLRSEQEVADYRDQGILPVGLLHPRILVDIRSHFLRGHYDTAVFDAFREVEIALREAVPGDSKRTGRDLVKDAFNPTTGKLRNTDPEVPHSEREGEFYLFNGAIGTHKNPGSHRRLPISRGETARLVLFASHLLFLVDERKAAPGVGAAFSESAEP